MWVKIHAPHFPITTARSGEHNFFCYAQHCCKNSQSFHRREHLLEGCDNAEIAGQLRIAQRTVKAYFNRLFLRFGITSGIKRVKLATCMYRSRLCSDMIFTGSDAQLNGNSASSPSSPRASVTGTSFVLEPQSTSS